MFLIFLMRSNPTTAGLLLACLFLMMGSALADVYKYRDYDGHVYLTDQPMRGTYKLVKRYRFKSQRRPVSGSNALAAMAKRRAQLEPLIDTAARASGLRPELVHAVVRAESAYRADAISSKGARGLMQLMPETAQRFGVTDLNDPRQNLRGGARYLSTLVKMFDSDLRLALAAYNAGENAVIRNGNRIPPYPETRQYVQKVLDFYRKNRAANQLARRD